MALVYANCAAVVFANGGRYNIDVDQVWDADDPFVKARPDLFNAEPVKVHRTAAPARPVEQATAAPGEVRGTKRAR